MPKSTVLDPGIDSIAELQKRTHKYFEIEMNPENGLVRDNTREDAPASVAGSGMALSCHIVAVSR